MIYVYLQTWEVDKVDARAVVAWVFNVFCKAPRKTIPILQFNFYFRVLFISEFTEMLLCESVDGYQENLVSNRIASDYRNYGFLQYLQT